MLVRGIIQAPHQSCLGGSDKGCLHNASESPMFYLMREARSDPLSRRGWVEMQSLLSVSSGQEALGESLQAELAERVAELDRRERGLAASRQRSLTE